MDDSGSVALRVQNMDPSDAAVILAQLASDQSGGASFSPRQLTKVYLDAGIPIGSTASNRIASMRRLGFVRDAGRAGAWRLTPLGRAKVRELLDAMDLAILQAEAMVDRGSIFGGALHTVVPPFLAPPMILGPLREFLAEYPFETNVFGMTRFPDPDPGSGDPVAMALEISREACFSHGLRLHLASDRAIVDDLWGNVTAHMWACHYGIGLFEDRMERGLNYNLNIEVGSMLMTGRRCALLKDVSIDQLPTDLVGQIYKVVDLSNLDTVSLAVHDWLRSDLGLGACPGCAA